MAPRPVPLARRRARLVAALAAPALALALALGPAGASAAPTPAPTPATIGPADLLAQARQAQLALDAIAAAAAGRPLPDGLSPQVAEDVARRIVVNNPTLGDPARLTAFDPALPVHWERRPDAGDRTPAPTGDTARLTARLRGTATVAYAAAPGRPARTATRPLARQPVDLTLARRDGGWIITGIAVSTASGSLAE